jgi:predicted Zn-dependent peptidase
MTRCKIHEATVAGGMKVAIESNPSAKVASLVWLLPVGYAGDPIGDAGAGEAAVLHDLILRGAGSRDSRAFSEALDRLGVQRATSSSGYHITISAACLVDALDEALPIIASMVTAPRIEAESLVASRELALQSLRSIRDDPQHFAMTKAAEHALPAPFNAHGHGTEGGLASLTVEQLRATWKRRARPKGSMLGIAGGVDPARVLALLERSLDGWVGESVEAQVTSPPLRGTVRENLPASQTSMALVYDAPRDSDTESVVHRLAVRILGGAGMSNRLFTEVREKRGLCYSVGMAYSAGRDRGIMQAFAGSTPERAPETLACMRAEISKMAEGVSVEEFNRGIVGLKSGIVMGGESTHARASAIASDLFRTGRARGLDEIASEVDRLTHKGLNAHASRAFGADVLARETLAVVGPQPHVAV